MDEWTEADGTIYRKNDKGGYDVIPPVKAKKPAKKDKKSKK